MIRKFIGMHSRMKLRSGIPVQVLRDFKSLEKLHHPHIAVYKRSHAGIQTLEMDFLLSFSVHCSALLPTKSRVPKKR